jgi:hypothetical protein
VYTYSPVPGAFPVSSYDADNYWVDLVYASSNTYSISGSVSGNGGGATVNLTGPETISTTADSSGNYSFDGLVDGSYTVAPNSSGVTFTPASRSVTINGGVVTGVNFSAVATNPQTISGTITGTGGAGATVNLSGAATATTTANASGNYSFTGLLNGTYTVDATATGFLFTPNIQQVVLTGTGATAVNFQEVCNCFSIWSASATPAVVDSNDGNPVEVGVNFSADASGLITALRFYKAVANTGTHVGHLWSSTGTLLGSVTFTGETASGWQQMAFSTPIAVTANTTYIASYFAPAGHYSANTNYFATSGVDSPPLNAPENGIDGPNGIYLYSSSGGFPSSSYDATNYWVDVLYVAGQSYNISGTISGAGGAGATVALTGAATARTTANASGAFSFTGLANGSYTVTPAATGATFTPASQAVTVNGANATANFSSTAVTYNISGTISGAGGAGATVALTGAATATTTANASGTFSFTGLANGSYTVTPTATGATFTPASQPVTVNGANQAGINFAAQSTTTPTYGISGVISPATLGDGATVSLSGTSSGTTIADANGNYSFAQRANGTYTVTPSENGITFTPANQSVTISGASVSSINFAAVAPSDSIASDVAVSRDVGSAQSTIASPVFTTTATNELLLAFIATDYLSGANTTVTSVSGAGLTWTLLKRTNAQSGTSEIWGAFATTQLTSATVTATLSHSVVSSITVMSFTGAKSAGAVGGNSATSGAPTASLLTTGNNSWVLGVGNDYDNAIARTLGTGQTLIHQYLSPTGDTYWVQMEATPIPASGTRATINDTAPTTDRYNLSIVEILAQ